MTINPFTPFLISQTHTRMKPTITVITVSAICLIIFATSCNKSSSTITSAASPIIEERSGGSTKFMNVLMYTKTAYDQHDAHSYAEGHILEFSNSNWQSLQTVNALKMQTALTYMKTAVVTGDTTGQYLNLFTYLISDAVYMD